MRAQPLALAVFEFGRRLGARQIGLYGALILLIRMTTIGQVGVAHGGEEKKNVVHDLGPGGQNGFGQ